MIRSLRLLPTVALRGFNPALLNRPVGLALSAVRKRPFCPFCADALRQLNAARAMARTGAHGLLVLWVVWRADKALRKARVAV